MKTNLPIEINSVWMNNHSGELEIITNFDSGWVEILKMKDGFQHSTSQELNHFLDHHEIYFSPGNNLATIGRGDRTGDVVDAVIYLNEEQLVALRTAVRLFERVRSGIFASILSSLVQTKGKLTLKNRLERLQRELKTGERPDELQLMLKDMFEVIEYSLLKFSKPEAYKKGLVPPKLYSKQPAIKVDVLKPGKDQE